MIPRVFTYLLLTGMLCSCAKDPQPVIPVRPPGCDSGQVSYRLQIRPIVQNNCAISGCHVAGGEGAYDYRTYTVLADRIRSGRLLQRLRLDREDPMKMPEDFDMNPCDRYTLELWIAQGFPDN
jgi:hypothetical protein